VIKSKQMKYFFHKHIEIITFLSPVLKKYDLFNRTSIHIVFLLFPLSIFVKKNIRRHQYLLDGDHKPF